MAAETLTRDTLTTGAGNDNTQDPPPPEVFQPDGEGDDYYSIQDGIGALEAYANGKPAPISVADGWEDRARSTEVGRGYAFSELNENGRSNLGAEHIIGRLSLQREMGRSRTSYGMPARLGANALRPVVLRQARRSARPR